MTKINIPGPWYSTDIHTLLESLGKKLQHSVMPFPNTDWSIDIGANSATHVFVAVENRPNGEDGCCVLDVYAVATEGGLKIGCGEVFNKAKISFPDVFRSENGCGLTVYHVPNSASCSDDGKFVCLFMPSCVPNSAILLW